MNLQLKRGGYHICKIVGCSLISLHVIIIYLRNLLLTLLKVFEMVYLFFFGGKPPRCTSNAFSLDDGFPGRGDKASKMIMDLPGAEALPHRSWACLQHVYSMCTCCLCTPLPITLIQQGSLQHSCAVYNGQSRHTLLSPPQLLWGLSHCSPWVTGCLTEFT